jgi:uncharacterized membrane protein (DUF2068 family)
MWLVFLVLLTPSPVHASSVLVQQNNGGEKSTSATDMFSVSFSSNVARGDIVVVALTGLHGASPMSVSDSLGSSYKSAGMYSSADKMVSSLIYTATLSSSGPNKVTGMFGTALGNPVDVYIFEVSGVTSFIVTGREATGSLKGPTTEIGADQSIIFQNGAALIALLSWFCPSPTVCSSTAGAGFTPIAEKSGLGFSQAEYSTSGVSSPTTFPASVRATGSVSGASWVELGVVLEPAGNTPPATTMNTMTTIRIASTSTTPRLAATTTVTEMESPLSEPYTLGGIIAIVAIIAIAIVGIIILKRKGWWPKPKAPTAGKVQQPPTTKADAKFCINCGQQILLASQFCKKCGAEQPQPSSQPSMTPEAKVTRRPMGVTIIAILNIAGGVILILGALMMLLLEGVAASILGPAVLFIRPLLSVITASLVIFAVVDFVIGWGLWKGKSWARLVSIVLLALGIISPILPFLILPAVSRMSAGAIWYMLQGSISGIIGGIVINVLFIYILMRGDAKAFFKKQP